MEVFILIHLFSVQENAPLHSTKSTVNNWQHLNERENEIIKFSGGRKNRKIFKMLSELLIWIMDKLMEFYMKKFLAENANFNLIGVLHFQVLCEKWLIVSVI